MPPATLLTNCSVVDVVSGTVTPKAAVLVQDNRIAAIGPTTTLQPPPDANKIDLAGAHVLPGLFNMHVHFGLLLPGVAGDRMQNETEAALALRMAQNAREALLSGVTTVRLTGERLHADFALKSSI